FKQLLLGLGFLHSNGIVHRDIKPENLLVSEEGQLRITDFGVSQEIFDRHDSDRDPNTFQLSKGVSGSRPYIAPEIWLAKNSADDNVRTDKTTQGGYDGRLSDLWSAAIVYIFMAVGGNLFSKADAATDINY
ncbi:kinase-like protein, partial [Nadsonia fulvescens var. elongata DSM 6958]